MPNKAAIPLAEQPPSYQDVTDASVSSITSSASPADRAGGDTPEIARPPSPDLFAGSHSGVCERVVSPVAHRVEAPTSILNAWESVRDDYLVDVSRAPSLARLPDVWIRSLHGVIKTCVYTQGNAPSRPVTMLMDSSTSKIATVFPSHVPPVGASGMDNDKPTIHLSVKSIHGKIEIRLQPSFQGTLLTQTLHGKIRLSDRVKANGSLIPNVQNMPYPWKVATHRITPGSEKEEMRTDDLKPRSRFTPASRRTTIGPRDHDSDHCLAETHTGSISICYWGEELPTENLVVDQQCVVS